MKIKSKFGDDKVQPAGTESTTIAQSVTCPKRRLRFSPEGFNIQGDLLKETGQSTMSNSWVAVVSTWKFRSFFQETLYDARNARSCNLSHQGQGNSRLFLHPKYWGAGMGWLNIL